jgi:hypothetical protein
MEQIDAMAELYHFGSALEFVAQSPILSAADARRLASKSKKKTTAASLPMASGAVVKVGDAKDGETKSGASGAKSSSLRSPTGKGSTDKKPTSDTVCDQCGNDFMKRSALENRQKNVPH